MNQQVFKYLHLKEKGLFFLGDLIKRSEFTRKCKGPSNLTFGSLEFLYTLTVLVLSVSVTHFEVRKQAGP